MLARDHADAQSAIGTLAALSRLDGHLERGSARDDEDLAALKGGWAVADLGRPGPVGPGPRVQRWERGSVADHLVANFEPARRCGEGMVGARSRPAHGDDEVFFRLVAARVLEPVSKLDGFRVLAEANSRPARRVDIRDWSGG